MSTSHLGFKDGKARSVVSLLSHGGGFYYLFDTRDVSIIKRPAMQPCHGCLLIHLEEWMLWRGSLDLLHTCSQQYIRLSQQFLTGGCGGGAGDL